MLQHRPQEEPEYRYDPQMQQKVITLASRLQEQQRETLTAKQMEALGEEVGLDPAFLHQAITQLSSKQLATASCHGEAQPSVSKAEFYSVCAAFAVPLLWGFLAYITKTSNLPRPQTTVVNMTSAIWFTLISPGPLAVLQGLLTGRKRLGFLAGSLLILALAPTFPYLYYYQFPDYLAHNISATLGHMLAYLVFGVPSVGLLGMAGAWIRQRYFPFASAQRGGPQKLSRAAMLQQLFALQGQLEASKQHRCFLSTDVVGSTQMKASSSALAVEHSFGQYRLLVEEVVHAHGGEVQAAAGDGIMGMFARDNDCVRAARQLHERLAQFNAIHNHLSLPFRIRCGISAGEVGIEDETAVGHLQSSILDRAALLQKQADPGGILLSAEVAAAGLMELGHLCPLSEAVNGVPAFAWKSQPQEHP